MNTVDVHGPVENIRPHPADKHCVAGLTGQTEDVRGPGSLDISPHRHLLGGDTLVLVSEGSDPDLVVSVGLCKYYLCLNIEI